MIDVLKYGEEIDIYIKNNKVYHKILYDNIFYIISETKSGKIKIERRNT